MTRNVTTRIVVAIITMKNITTTIITRKNVATPIVIVITITNIITMTMNTDMGATNIITNTITGITMRTKFSPVGA